MVSCASRNSVLEGFQSYMCIVNATDQNTEPVLKYLVWLLSVCVSAKVGKQAITNSLFAAADHLNRRSAVCSW